MLKRIIKIALKKYWSNIEEWLPLKFLNLWTIMNDFFKLQHFKHAGSLRNPIIYYYSQRPHQYR